jgi:Regulator of ribonuclease activity B
MTSAEKMDLLRENAEVLHSLGYDPRVELAPRRIDFSIVFPNDASRLEAVAKLNEMGFEYELSDESVSPDMPEVNAFKVLHPTADAITDAEYTLNQYLKDFGARTDGWGLFEDTVQ